MENLQALLEQQEKIKQMSNENLDTFYKYIDDLEFAEFKANGSSILFRTLSTIKSKVGIEMQKRADQDVHEALTMIFKAYNKR